MSDIRKRIEEEIKLQQRALHFKEERLRHLPEGYLVQQDSKQSSRLYWVRPVAGSRPRRYHHDRLSQKDYKTAEAIRDKFLFRQQCRAYRKNIKHLKSLLEHYTPCDDETILSQMDEPYRSLGGLQPSPSEHQPCTSENPFHRKHLIHRNSIGELFRSKSEVHVSELLLTNKIPYRYEQKLTIAGETKYPDFTIEMPGSKRKKYIEYFGKMDDSDYTGTLAERINWYLNRGLLQGRDVLFLFENSKTGLDLILVWKQIESFLAI